MLIEQIGHVAFEPLPPIRVGRGGFLRLVRWVSPSLAAGLIISFTLHCTRPPAPMPRARKNPSGSPTLGVGEVFVEEGIASWYGGNGDGFAGRPTASGETFDPTQMTAAHKTLPLGTHLEVENLDTHRKAIVRVNDRGPYIRGRIIDLSRRAAQELGILGPGSGRVRITTVDPEDRPLPLDPAEEARNPYVIQVAALSEPRNVEALKAEMERDFGPVEVQEAIARGGVTVRRVRVGSYTRREDAEKAADQIAKRLKDRGVEPFITRRR
ncbi:MAG TPA: septal ring lytic transglycosylase RlpA family protein [Holophagaceae bacterium]|nr:septal ring lytic transglycosylase RlpA family protein [Holophagaceae bacterium]